VTEPGSFFGRGSQGPSGPRADFWFRLGGFVVDSVILGLVGQLIGFAVSVFVVGWLISVAFGIVYHVYFIASPSGQTPGMRVFKTRAISAIPDGRIDLGAALIRYVVGLLSGIACFIGYLWMLWDPERQTWHDKVARTYVVPVSAYPVERWPG
jgi:uncharacterized RDD family membrane protein YckC